MAFRARGTYGVTWILSLDFNVQPFYFIQKVGFEAFFCDNVLHLIYFAARVRWKQDGEMERGRGGRQHQLMFRKGGGRNNTGILCVDEFEGETQRNGEGRLIEKSGARRSFQSQLAGDRKRNREVGKGIEAWVMTERKVVIHVAQPSLFGCGTDGGDRREGAFGPTSGYETT